MNTEIVTINNIDIECPYENDQHYVAIRPICEILNLGYRKQFERIKRDNILSQVVSHTLTSSSADGKTREMLCLPLRYIFGWLFSIDESKAKPEAQASLIQYKLECYDALYDRFYAKAALYEKKERILAEKQHELTRAKMDAKAQADRVKQIEKQIKEIRETPATQLSLFSS